MCGVNEAKAQAKMNVSPFLKSHNPLSTELELVSQSQKTLRIATQRFGGPLSIGGRPFTILDLRRNYWFDESPIVYQMWEKADGLFYPGIASMQWQSKSEWKSCLHKQLPEQRRILWAPPLMNRVVQGSSSLCSKVSSTPHNALAWSKLRAIFRMSCLAP